MNHISEYSGWIWCVLCPSTLPPTGMHLSTLSGSSSPSPGRCLRRSGEWEPYPPTSLNQVCYLWKTQTRKQGRQTWIDTGLSGSSVEESRFIRGKPRPWEKQGKGQDSISPESKKQLGLVVFSSSIMRDSSTPPPWSSFWLGEECLECTEVKFQGIPHTWVKARLLDCWGTVWELNQHLPKKNRNWA
jgi:hypothetical protein